MMAPRQLADLAVLSRDYFSVPEDDIKGLESVLTIVGGRVVHASGDFAAMAPPALPVSPSWTPVTGGAAATLSAAAAGHAPTPNAWSCGCSAF